MAKLQINCPNCKKITQVEGELSFGSMHLWTLKCGHTMPKIDTVAVNDAAKVTSISGKSFFQYQKDGIDFVVKANGRALIADEMGLGKTPQSIGFVISNPAHFPVLIVTKAGVVTQFAKEFLDWAHPTYGDEITPFIISSPDMFLPGFKVYIVSVDTLWRMETKTPEIFEYGFKTLVIDECQTIKDATSKRTRGVIKMAQTCEHVLALSATPFKNNGEEYFTILNILRPEKFPNKASFMQKYMHYTVGQSGTKSQGFKHLDRFMDDIKDFVIRREMNDVHKDMPEYLQSNIFCDFEDGNLLERYKQVSKEFQDFYDRADDIGAKEITNLLGLFAQMRHLTGLAKIDPVLNYATDFLLTTERKLCIFVHHKDVAELLTKKLNAMLKDGGFNFTCTEIRSDMNSAMRDSELERFKSSSRIMVASTLAAGEGLNMQFCSDAILMERQWNPANEWQAMPGRFRRIGQTNKVHGNIFVAVGTIDEYLTEIVEKKRAVMKQGLDGIDAKWDESSLMVDLAHMLASKNRKRWGW